MTTVIEITPFAFGQSLMRADLDQRVTGELCRTSGRMYLLLVLARTLVTRVTLLHMVERRRGLPQMPVVTMLPNGSKPTARVKLGQPFLTDGAAPVPAESRKYRGGGNRRDLLGPSKVKIRDLGKSAWRASQCLFLCAMTVPYFPEVLQPQLGAGHFQLAGWFCLTVCASLRCLRRSAFSLAVFAGGLR